MAAPHALVAKVATGHPPRLGPGYERAKARHLAPRQNWKYRLLNSQPRPVTRTVNNRHRSGRTSASKVDYVLSLVSGTRVTGRLSWVGQRPGSGVTRGC